MDTPHIIKLEYQDGCKLETPVSWCGQEVWRDEWLFQDAQHALLSLGRSTTVPCADCLAAITKLIGEKQQ